MKRSVGTCFPQKTLHFLQCALYLVFDQLFSFNGMLWNVQVVRVCMLHAYTFNAHVCLMAARDIYIYKNAGYFLNAGYLAAGQASKTLFF